jgi:hypothetical protein
MSDGSGTRTGCTCDPVSPARKRCTGRTIRCVGAMAAHADPPELPDDEEETAQRLARVLGQLAATARPCGAFTKDALASLAAASDFLDRHAFNLRKARMIGTDS